jgi:hypothetical protein
MHRAVCLNNLTGKDSLDSPRAQAASSAWTGHGIVFDETPVPARRLARTRS